jgi:hypothetical protein
MSDAILRFPTLSPQDKQSILDGPALRPPEGVTPIFESAPTRNGESITVFTICMIMTTMAVCGRVYTRVFLLKKVQAQDCALIISCMPSSAD